MPTLDVLIDSLCANFTVESMHDLVRARLALGPCTISDIAHEITRKDRSLDSGSGHSLAEAAVKALVQSGHVEVQDSSTVRWRRPASG